MRESRGELVFKYTFHTSQHDEDFYWSCPSWKQYINEDKNLPIRILSERLKHIHSQLNIFAHFDANNEFPAPGITSHS